VADPSPKLEDNVILENEGSSIWSIAPAGDSIDWVAEKSQEHAISEFLAAMNRQQQSLRCFNSSDS